MSIKDSETTRWILILVGCGSGWETSILVGLLLELDDSFDNIEMEVFIWCNCLDGGWSQLMSEAQRMLMLLEEDDGNNMLSIVDDTELWRFRQPDGNEDERRF